MGVEGIDCTLILSSADKIVGQFETCDHRSAIQKLYIVLGFQENSFLIVGGQRIYLVSRLRLQALLQPQELRLAMPGCTQHLRDILH